MSCPFCIDTEDTERMIVWSTELVFATLDEFAVSSGHALIVARRHVATWADLTVEERTAINDAINPVVDRLKDWLNFDDYNVGFNSGEYAGQTVPHFHMHIIPRYEGDSPNPRGGVRNVLPGGDYLK